MDTKTIEVRAYDLGGFGDVSAAMRTASHLSDLGFDVGIRSVGSYNKLRSLGYDVNLRFGPSADIAIDVAGHYDDENIDALKPSPPHIFFEDMDNRERGILSVPLYVRTGLQRRTNQVPWITGNCEAPMFYRPLREWDLPKLEMRDVKQQLMSAFVGRESSGLESMIDSLDHVAFVHLSPKTSHQFLNSSYVTGLVNATEQSGGRYGIGIFMGDGNNLHLAAVAEEFPRVLANGSLGKGARGKPILMFLGHRPQLETTALFLSATMPNVVTGDLSLSDAIYGLIAMDGPAFFYDEPQWKEDTYKELVRIFGGQWGFTDAIFRYGSQLTTFMTGPTVRKAYGRRIGDLFASPSDLECYRNEMRRYLITEIEERFGDGAILPSDGRRYIGDGAPFLIQDQVKNAVEFLIKNPQAKSELDSMRERLSTRHVPAV